MSLQGASYRCPRGHNFDRAARGYLNLLLPQHKNSLQPGDSKAMVDSRARFLAGGHYAPIADRLIGMLAERAARGPARPLQVADVGCGVGYYLGRLAEALGPERLTGWGLDISKEAIWLACRASRHVTWLIASSKVLPFRTASCDVVLSVFSPLDFAELARVLAPTGLLALVTPAADHLIELRSALFETVRPIDPDKVLEKAAADFVLERRLPIRFALALDTPEAIRDLLTMTPFFWKSLPDKRAALLARERLDLTVDVVLSVFAPRPVV